MLAAALLAAYQVEPVSTDQDALEVTARNGRMASASSPSEDAVQALLRRDGVQGTMLAKLGVNYTLNHSQRLYELPADTFAGAIRHVRFFYPMNRDYNPDSSIRAAPIYVPATTSLAPCLDGPNPWSCAKVSPQQNMVRVRDLRKVFPSGYVFVAAEVLGGRGYPCKGWSAEEMGPNPRQSGYEWGRVMMASLGQYPGVVLAFTNEEWCKPESDPGRQDAMNEWRRGVIQAHRENPACQLSIGARHPPGGRDGLGSGVDLIAPDIWQYLDDVGGWANVHTHPTENGVMVSSDRVLETGDIARFDEWVAWMKANYPNIRRYVGELSYTSSPFNTTSSIESRREDWSTLERLIKYVADEVEIVFLYQIADQPGEGAFSGTGIYPYLIDSVRALASEPTGRRAAPPALVEPNQLLEADLHGN